MVSGRVQGESADPRALALTHLSVSELLFATLARGWQGDLFAAAGTLHCLVHGDYMPMDSIPSSTAKGGTVHRPRFQHKR